MWYLQRNGRQSLLVCLLLSAFVSTAYGKEQLLSLPPAPRAVTSGQIDFFERTPESAKNNKVHIFYATTRLPMDDESGYKKSFDENLRLGSAALTIGPDDMDWEVLHKQATTAKRPAPTTTAQKHQLDIHLKRVDQVGKLSADDSLTTLSPGVQRYIDQLNSAIEQSHSKDITIIVHGAFNSFYYASAVAAQYHFYTGKQAVVITYAWPAVENNLAYGRNVKNAEQSKAGLKSLIKLLGEHSDAQRINIIGYSVGGRLTGGVIAQIADEHNDQNLTQIGKELRLGHLYLTGSDQPIEEFSHYAQQFGELFEEVTVTIAYDDPILGRAQFTGGGNRLGRPPKPTDDKSKIHASEEQKHAIRQAVSDEQLYILDLETSDITGYEFLHGAWYLNPWVSSDVFVSLHLRLAPAERGLASDEQDNLRYWYFPKNYVSTLRQALLLYKTRRNRQETEVNHQ
jgi:esterase/lipase superfamily enzyme